MKKLGVVLSGGLLILVGLWWMGLRDTAQPKVKQNIQMTYAPKIDDQNEVKVEVVPVSLGTGSEVNFKVVLETHSVELDYDMRGISVLLDDQGIKYQPLSWSGGRGGHHLSGNLIFPKISTGTKELELVMLGVSGVDRKFKWELFSDGNR